MSYFTDVYLKRVNRFGHNTQDRIYNKMVHDFDNFVAKSPNRVEGSYQDEKYVGVLETVKTTEKEIIDYFLTSKENLFSCGAIIDIPNRDRLGEIDKWMVLDLEKYETIGYNKYKVILLDKEISWVGNDKVTHSSWCHFTGTTAAGRDKVILESFKVSFNHASVDIPSNSLRIVIPTNDSLIRNGRFLVNKKAWKISERDTDSIDGVMMVSAFEDYLDEENDMDYADGYKLSSWRIVSSLGDNIQLSTEPTEIKFLSYYNNNLEQKEILVSIADSSIVKYEEDSLIPLKKGNTTVEITIDGIPKDIYSKTITVEVVEQEEKKDLLFGAPTLKVFRTNKYEITSDANIDDLNFESVNGKFKVIKKESSGEAKFVTIEGLDTGNDIIQMKLGDNIIYSLPIEIIGMWM